MAGAGYKLFNTGDVLTAAQVNTYLQEQVVMVFANAAARTTALSGVLAEGMVTYLKDTDALEIYSGAAWVGYGSGDITGITTGATSGLTGGVTSGTADLKLNTTAKGGLLVGTGSGTVSELAVGSNTQVLTADSTTATGLKWATAAGGGKVLQVVQGLATSNSVTTSTSFVDCGLSASITPSSTSSKVLVFLNIAGAGKVNNGGGTSARFNLVRDTTTIIRLLDRGLFTNTNDYLLGIPVNAVYLDSPASTSSLTYKAQMSSSSGTEIGYNYWATNTVTSSIVLMEIGA